MSSVLDAVAIPKHRFNEVIEHLRFNFFADEPLNSGVGLCKKGEAHLELENHCMYTLKQGYSRMLVTDDGVVSLKFFYLIFLSTYFIKFIQPYLKKKVK